MAPGLDPGKRSQLLNQLGSAIQDASRKDAEIKARIAEQDRATAAASAASRLIAENERKEQSVQQLVQRFNALMEQQQFHEANSDVAPLIREQMRNEVIQRSVEQISAFAANDQLTKTLSIDVAEPLSTRSI